MSFKSFHYTEGVERLRCKEHKGKELHKGDVADWKKYKPKIQTATPN